jgi:hypothetical protein
MAYSELVVFNREVLGPGLKGRFQFHLRGEVLRDSRICMEWEWCVVTKDRRSLRGCKMVRSH